MLRTWVRFALTGALVLGVTACDGDDDDGNGIITDPTDRVAPLQLQPSQNFPTIQFPAGYRIEKVVEGLTFPTGLTCDDQRRMYVVEAGGAFLEEPPLIRILRFENGRATPMINLKSSMRAAAAGLTFHQGAFFVSHRDPQNRTCVCSRT